GLRSPRPSLRLRRPRAPHRRGDDEAASRQAPSGLRGQGQRRSRGHRPGLQADRRGRRQPVRRAGGQARRGSQQRWWPPQPLDVLGVDGSRRRRRPRGRARRGDQLRLRLLRRLQGEVRGGGRRPVRLRLGMARSRRRPAGHHQHAEPGQPRVQRPDPAARQRRLGARVLPELPEPPPGLPQGVVERGQLEQGLRALQRREGL
ncbi:MAG: Superoxide dismutase [Mn], partial [uncultured Solirubrobacteraceae bacterium]